MVHVNIRTAMIVLPFLHPVLMSDQLDTDRICGPSILQLHVHPAQPHGAQSSCGRD